MSDNYRKSYFALKYVVVSFILWVVSGFFYDWFSQNEMGLFHNFVLMGAIWGPFGIAGYLTITYLPNPYEGSNSETMGDIIVGVVFLFLSFVLFLVYNTVARYWFNIF